MFLESPVDAINNILEECPAISQLEFSLLDGHKKSRNDTLSPLSNKNKQFILEAKQNIGVSFWQAALGLYPADLLNDRESRQAIMHHNGPGEIRAALHRDDFINDGLKNLPFGPADGSINLLSCAYLDNGNRCYMPMLDFRLKQSYKNLQCVLAVCEELFNKQNIRFFVVKSKTSYHAYGGTLFNNNTYCKFLGMALLFDPIVDGRHVAHQLIDGVGALRIK